MAGDEITKTQLVWLCWVLTAAMSGVGIAPGRAGSVAVPPGFATRCRKLLEQGVGTPDLPGRPGMDTLFDRFQAWEMAIALLLSNLGLPQGHIAYCLDDMRAKLRGAYRRIRANPPARRDRIPASDRPGTPVQIADPAYADTDCFVLLRPVEIREALPSKFVARHRKPGAPPRQPLVEFDAEQDIVYGSAALAERLTLRSKAAPLGRSYGERGWIIIELSELVGEIDRLWHEVPAIRRGRPARGLEG